MTQGKQEVMTTTKDTVNMAQGKQEAKKAVRDQGKQDAKTVTKDTANAIQAMQEAKTIANDSAKMLQGKQDAKPVSVEGTMQKTMNATMTTGQAITTADMAHGKQESITIKNEATIPDASNASNDSTQHSMPQSPERKIRERREGYGEIEQYQIELIKQKRARIHDDTQKHRVRKNAYLALKKDYQKNRREENILKGKLEALYADLVPDEELGAANRKQFELLDRQELELGQEWTKYYNLQRETAPSYECLKDAQSKQQ